MSLHGSVITGNWNYLTVTPFLGLRKREREREREKKLTFIINLSEH